MGEPAQKQEMAAPVASENDNGRAHWLTIDEAAAYLGYKGKSRAKAVQRHVDRGNLVPDHWGGRGRLKGHRFLRATLDRFMVGGK